jgi:hypothetical protein
MEAQRNDLVTTTRHIERGALHSAATGTAAHAGPKAQARAGMRVRRR